MGTEPGLIALAGLFPVAVDDARHAFGVGVDQHGFEHAPGGLVLMPPGGAAVIVDHLGSVERGVVHAVDAERRSVVVATEDGRLLGFSLNRATATFTRDGSQTGSRLRFEPARD